MRGGYLVIDLGGVSLSTTAVVVKGIYDRIEGNFGKPLMLSGINYGGVEHPEAYIMPTVSSGNFVISAYGKTITITDEDKVTIA